MDSAEWLQETTRVAFPPPNLQAPPAPCATLTFDTSQELLWTGDGFGRITSFYGSGLQRYTSYRGHDPSEGPVRQILPCEKGILSISRNSVHLSIRRGLTVWHCMSPTFMDLRCICFVDKATNVALVAGCQAKMFKVLVETGEIIESMPASDHYTLFRRTASCICAATSSGSVHVLDSDSLRVLKVWKAHGGWINDMDANSSLLVTCGGSPRPHHGNMLDPMAKVFDLRTLTHLNPIAFPAGAAFVRMHPRFLTACIISSQNGQFQLMETTDAHLIHVKYASHSEEHTITGLDFSTSSEALILADSMCILSLWGPTHSQKVRFTDYSNPTEFPDAPSADKPFMEVNSSSPISSVGMPYYRETLLSGWPSHLVFDVGAIPVKIEPATLAAMSRGDIGLYGPNPRITRRNQAPHKRLQSKEKLREGPKFLSEQAKEDSSTQVPPRRMSETQDAFAKSRLNGEARIDIPVIYQNVEIKYSRFGVDDFDFEYYNKTRFSGLETHIANSYANPLLQVLRFTPSIRNLALHHAATSCLRDTCLLCELGFLIDMLEKAQGQNCQATNFLKTFSSLSQTGHLGLLDEGPIQRPLNLMIQATNRFLLDKIVSDFQQSGGRAYSHTMQTALETKAETHIRCANCANQTKRNGDTNVHEMVYPDSLSPKMNLIPTFSNVLKASVERQDYTRAWCDRCKRYQQLNQSKIVQATAPVLMLNTAIQSPTARQLWSRPGWLPREIGIIVQHGQVFCYEGMDLQTHIHRARYPIQVYELVGIVADIHSGEQQKQHLVAIINVSHSVTVKETRPNNDWFLFNDFLVKPITEDDALQFEPAWKLPVVLAYELKSERQRIDHSWQDHLDPTILFRPGTDNVHEQSTYVKPLSFDHERPEPGNLVGIDAEFVSLRQEEIEIKPDGSRSIRLPARLGLARVSVLRGDFENDRSSDEDNVGINQDGTIDTLTKAPDGNDVQAYLPFVDDYIAISDPIVNYLTQFSGISPGDLSPQTSPYAASGRLVSLKIAYKKIWLLLNLGCIFVGHGLLKDFRTINIHVPKSQVIDTVELFYLKQKARKLSLRFLSWLVLEEEVQVGMHDSIEDARMALKLYKRYQEYEKEGNVPKVLEEIYKRGFKTGFKVPSAHDSPSKVSQDFSHDQEVRGHGSLSATPRERSAGLVEMKAVYSEGG